MNDHTNQESQHHGKEPVKRREMSRRQFLSYTLGGAGAFMGAGMLVPMIRFAVDPVLQPKAQAAWVKVVEEAKITNEPKSFKFKVHQVDGWYESDPELEAWISKGQDGKIFALNPTCKHLGCTVNWNSNPEYKEQYYCPCHGAHYTADGKNLAVAPAPLDQYELKIENGFVYLGQLGPNKRV
ncbi:ubiquinol-cytochrome c reductase iron-sulfur subunit [Paenibacillus allorhizosphaerae]|uniref:Cytochrome b6-f complex iron-sulfur subunit n=1 Tax=Paenibacillus allorhizosphaerae TaxID=2849866 RepID=A0ABM8VLS3_9BACL|nr:ubiquinol-cytochrome c reductase iron-sulfur subunit [Paenibacillus allorhizosphaerae]CAG7648836.1 Cytochrome b6-f complex iron-sulfur subunit [Paenibacillus allorhizosphaerae]